MSMSTYSWMSIAIPLCVLRSLVSLRSCVTTWLLVRQSMMVFLFILTLVVFSDNFGCHVGDGLFVRYRLGIWRMEVATRCSHWSVSSTYGVLGSVSSMLSVVRVCMTVPVSLCMSTTFFLMKNSLEVRCQFSTFINFWINNTIIVLMLIGILVHDLWWLMRIALILSSFQFMKSLVQLNISELLFDSSVSILCHTSVVSWSSSCTRAITSGISTSESFENIVLANWAIVTVWRLSHWFMTLQSCRRINRIVIVFW